MVAFIFLNLIRLALYPLFALVGVNQFFLVYGPNSSGLIELAQRARGANAQVWLDRDLTDSVYWMCNGVTAGEALEYLLTLNSVAVNTFDVDQFADAAPHWIAVTPEHGARLQAHIKMKLIAAPPPPAVHCAPAVIQLYEIES